MSDPYIEMEDGTPTFKGDLGPEGGKIEVPEDPALRERFASLFEHMKLGPDGTVPPLDPELRLCLVEREAGTMINHPLVHTFYISMENGRYNEMLKAKRELIEEYRAEKKWDLIFLVGIVERPYQLTYLLKWADEMPDEVYWEIAGDIWTDSENIWQYTDEWREVFSDDRPGREHMMDEETYEKLDEGEPPREQNERAYLESLPEVIKVYRGTSAPDGLGSGFSWTLDRDRAIFFAKRLGLPGRTTLLISGRVKKENVIAFFDRRTEKEIVCFPEHVFDRMEKRLR